ncbi:MAG TPA: pyruvate kinase [Candidatus Sulfotelmatobacter sp.]|nr:pyruvate kinase [Candidatus Sulfotelmatobacter sp.]
MIALAAQRENNGQPGRPSWDPKDVESLLTHLHRIRADMLELERKRTAQIEAMQPIHRESTRNLLHYLALRRHDIRSLQERLAEMGLSSLGRSESHVLANLDAVLAVLGHLAGVPPAGNAPGGPALTFVEGKQLLQAHTEALLGSNPPGRTVRIMVTMPTEAAEDGALVRELVARGMDVMRINCAHDDVEAWAAMVHHLQRARRKVRRNCRVLMDLGGPKLRTGPMEPGPRVLRWRPRRDVCGRVTTPAQVWFYPVGRQDLLPAGVGAAVPVPEPWLIRLRPGDRVELVDLRGSRRRVQVTERREVCRIGEAAQTAYVGPGTVLHARGVRGRTERKFSAEARVGDLPPVPQALLLKPGDTLLLTRSLAPGVTAVRDAAGRVLEPARIGCTLPEVFAQVRPNERIWFDDGKLGGLVTGVEEDLLRVQITQTADAGTRLGPDKGINLPDSQLSIPSLTPKDIEDLPFIAGHADLVGFSFVRRPEDIRELEARLAQIPHKDLGLVLKIETRPGFEQLPNLLLAALAQRPVGVMIARGDLAVECGYERLAEVQEEILWICEAAHVPVIWATEVLENLSKRGTPTRAEITDAAMAQRAECVMLGKGPHVAEAVRALDDILVRMQAHQRKKSPRLRPLRLSEMAP